MRDAHPLVRLLADPARAGEAIAALEQVLAVNPYFSPLHAGIARQTLDALRGRS